MFEKWFIRDEMEHEQYDIIYIYLQQTRVV